MQNLLKNILYIQLFVYSCNCRLRKPLGKIKEKNFQIPETTCDQTFNQNFNSLIKIGKGNFGEVRQYGENKVIKQICPKNNVSQEKFELEKNREIYFLQQTYQEAEKNNMTQNFIQFFNCYKDQNGCYYLEIQIKGDHLGYTQNSNNKAYKFLEIFNEQERQKIYLNFFKSLQLIHNMGIVHCDIKPDNLLLDIKFENFQINLQQKLAHISIGDFGLTRYTNESLDMTNSIFNHPIILYKKYSNQTFPALPIFDVYAAILSIFTIENYKQNQNFMYHYTLMNQQFKQELLNVHNVGEQTVEFFLYYFQSLRKKFQIFIKQHEGLDLSLEYSTLDSCENFYCVIYQSINEDINLMPSLNTIIENIERINNKNIPNQEDEYTLQLSQDDEYTLQLSQDTDYSLKQILDDDYTNKIDQEEKFKNQNKSVVQDVTNKQTNQQLLTNQNSQQQTQQISEELTQEFYKQEPSIDFQSQTYIINYNNQVYKFQEQEQMLTSQIYFDLQNVQKPQQIVLEIQKNQHFNYEQKIKAFQTFQSQQLSEFFLYDQLPELKQQQNYNIAYSTFTYKINFMLIDLEFFSDQINAINNEDQYYREFNKLFRGIKDLHNLNLVHFHISPLTIVQTIEQQVQQLNLKFTNLGFYDKGSVYQKSKMLRNIQQFAHQQIRNNIKKNDFVIDSRFDIYSLSLTCLLIFMNKGYQWINRYMTIQVDQNYETKLINLLKKELNVENIDNNIPIDMCQQQDSKKKYFICIMISSLKNNLNDIPSIDLIIENLNRLNSNLILI